MLRLSERWVLQFDTEWRYGCVVSTFFFCRSFCMQDFFRIIYSWIDSFYVGVQRWLAAIFFSLTCYALLINMIYTIE